MSFHAASRTLIRDKRQLGGHPPQLRCGLRPLGRLRQDEGGRVHSQRTLHQAPHRGQGSEAHTNRAWGSAPYSRRKTGGWRSWGRFRAEPPCAGAERTALGASAEGDSPNFVLRGFSEVGGIYPFAAMRSRSRRERIWSRTRRKTANRSSSEPSAWEGSSNDQ